MIAGGLSLLAQSNSGNAGQAAGVFFVLMIELALIVLIVIGLWKVFTKAGHPGWAAIVPIYNMYILLQIAGRPGWWLIFFFIPFVSLVFAIIVAFDVAKSFGKSGAFGAGLAFLPMIFYPILGFGDAQYMGSGGGPVARGFDVVPRH